MKRQDDIYESVKAAIRTGLYSSEWWPLVHVDVKDYLELIINSIDVLGWIFRDAFESLIKYEHARRVIQNRALDETLRTAIFGSKMSEEVYQSSTLAVRVLLDLDDWVKPNEADVRACQYIIDVVQALDRLSVFKLTHQNTPESILSRLTSNKQSPKKNITPNLENTDIRWRFGDDPYL